MSRIYTAKTSRSQTRRGREKGLFKLAANPRGKKLSATATEEHDWSNDVPSIKLSTAFLVILALHIALVVGVLVFRQFGGPVAGNSAEAADAATPTVASAAASPEVTQSSTSAINSVGASFRPNAPEFDGFIKHRVRPLENIDQIAGEYAVTRSALESMNKIGVDNPFRTGMLLVIPPREIRAVRPEAAQIAVAPTTTDAGPATGTAEVRRALPVTTAVGMSDASGTAATTTSAAGTHTVAQGETLWGISRIYNVTPDAIMAANGIKDARSLKIGATLKIPGR